MGKVLGAVAEELTSLLVSCACEALQSCPIKGGERLAGDGCHCEEGLRTADRQTNKHGRARQADLEPEPITRPMNNAIGILRLPIPAQ